MKIQNETEAELAEYAETHKKFDRYVKKTEDMKQQFKDTFVSTVFGDDFEDDDDTIQ